MPRLILWLALAHALSDGASGWLLGNADSAPKLLLRLECGAYIAAQLVAATFRLSRTLLTPSVALAIETAFVRASIDFTVPLSVTVPPSTSMSMLLSSSTVFQSARYWA